jgi:predicted lipid-binding transport protein (Tim44 family)
MHMKLWLIPALLLAFVATSSPLTAEAKRLGGGKPAGMQRNMPARTTPDATPAKPATPPQQAAPQAVPSPAAAPAPAPKRSWLGPLAGLAAGIGLGALLSHFGLGAGVANALMMVLLVGAAILLVMFLLRRFGPRAQAGGPVLAGAGAPMPREPWAPTPAPMERQTIDITAAPAALPAPTTAATAAVAANAAIAQAPARAFVPASFDSEGFARTAKMIFIRLQAANDSADLDDLRRFTTPELFASIRLDIQERGATPQQTDVVRVESEVLDVAQEAEREVVSVRFHGEVVEEKGAAAVPFNEVWHLVKPRDDSQSWMIAGIEPIN